MKPNRLQLVPTGRLDMHSENQSGKHSDRLKKNTKMENKENWHRIYLMGGM